MYWVEELCKRIPLIWIRMGNCFFGILRARYGEGF